MDAFAETLSVTGLSGLLAALARVDPEDRDLAIEEFSRVAPLTVANIPVRRWNASLHKIAITLCAESDDADFLLLGNDLVFLEALAAIEHRGLTQILASPQVGSKQAIGIERNVPYGLPVEVLPLGLVPLVPATTAVIVIAFEAGGGYLLVEKHAARALGAIHGQQFTGEVIALLPLSDAPVHERPANWQMVRRDRFSAHSWPDGLETITPKF